jgi:glycerol-3-phosphate acyltransferase PlsY
MTEWTAILGTLFASYVVGGIPFGLIIGRLKGIDVREHGSGNIGATNVLRLCGKPLGLLCFALDFAKGCVPVLAARAVAAAYDLPHAELVPVVAVVGAVAGHVWCPFLRFRGGKGVATSAGAVMAVAPEAVLAAIVLWYVIFALTRYVSLASIVAAAALPLVATGVLLARGGGAGRAPVLVLLYLLATMIVVRHRANIQRLLDGSENRIPRKDEAS